MYKKHLLKKYKDDDIKKQEIGFMAKETLKYEEAMTRLESIVSDMENGNLDIDTLCEKVKTAQKLIKVCRDKLTKTDDEIKKILTDE